MNFRLRIEHKRIMARITITLTMFFLANLSFAQLSSAEKEYCRQGLITKVNDLRKELGAPLLKPDASLKCAAERQSSYMAKNRKLTHIQKKEKDRTVMQRVDACSKEGFSFVGENISCFEPAKVKRSDAVLDAMVDRMYRLWFESKDHYWNMVNSAFTHCDYGFAYDRTSNNIYCAQVLGKP